MSYFRSYFSKNNTIIEDSMINTAKNPDTELFYGCKSSKFIFKIDLDPLKTSIENGDYILDDNTRHYLHLTNTIFGDESLLGDINGRDRERATSFDLVLFPIEEFWDEGVGYYYQKEFDSSYGSKSYSLEASNWCYRTSLDEWSERGVYTGTPVNIVSTIHFDNGNEDINVDITSSINDILSGNTENIGLGLAFSPDYYCETKQVEQSVAFFTKYTNTFFEPYLETVFDDTIRDDRSNFTIGISNNNLFLYVTKNGNYYDLDYLPTVDITNSLGVSISGLTELSVTKIKKGIYKVSFGISGELCGTKQFFYDKWCDISIDGVLLDCITQKFLPKNILETYSIGGYNSEIDRYAIQFFGVKLNEKIKRGSIRKVLVSFKSINQTNPILLDESYYRIYIKEGHTHVNVFDWTLMDKTTENSFNIDTRYMIPREYWVEIKAKINGEEIYYKDEIKFEIISEK